MDTALMTATLFLAAAFAAAMALAARRSIAPRERLRFAHMVEQAGVGPGSLGQRGVLWEISRAAQTCARCPRGVQCQAWLDAGQQDGFDAFCPNAGLVRRIARAQTGR